MRFNASFEFAVGMRRWRASVHRETEVVPWYVLVGIERGCRCGSSNMISTSCKLVVRGPGGKEDKIVLAGEMWTVKKIGVSRDATEGAWCLRPVWGTALVGGVTGRITY